MPRPPRRSKSRRAGYDAEHVRHLLEGVYLCPGHAFTTRARNYGGDFTDVDALREGWETLRDSLMPEWIEKNPGKRPCAWWRFDARERRQRVDGVQHPFDNRIRKARIEKMSASNPEFREHATELFYGKPRALIVKDDFDAEYETETAYLTRLNLLTDAEREALQL